MPELPEVETIRRGLSPVLQGHRVIAITVRHDRLRHPIPVAALQRHLVGEIVREVQRRGKYLLFPCGSGGMILHLGMSGVLRLTPLATPPQKHDHLDIDWDNGLTLRFHDPRRFGAILWSSGPCAEHPALQRLGPEPLTHAFDGAHLLRVLASRSGPIKNVLMDNAIVTGVGNIYAAESLFAAGIHPARRAASLTATECCRLAEAVKQILDAAIQRGGTTIRDFRHDDGKPGYFQHELAVYGRAGEPCRTCTTPIAHLRQGGRSSWFCPTCQAARSEKI